MFNNLLCPRCQKPFEKSDESQWDLFNYTSDCGVVLIKNNEHSYQWYYIICDDPYGFSWYQDGSIELIRNNEMYVENIKTFTDHSISISLPIEELKKKNQIYRLHL